MGKDEPVMEFQCKCIVVSANFLELSTKVIHMNDLHVQDTGTDTFTVINNSHLNIPYSVFLVNTLYPISHFNESVSKI
jgi:hypothetical protein